MAYLATLGYEFEAVIRSFLGSGFLSGLINFCIFLYSAFSTHVTEVVQHQRCLRPTNASQLSCQKFVNSSLKNLYEYRGACLK